jgi:hypothetical protein
LFRNENHRIQFSKITNEDKSLLTNPLLAPNNIRWQEHNVELPQNFSCSPNPLSIDHSNTSINGLDMSTDINSPRDYFQLVFPIEKISDIIHSTNLNISQYRQTQQSHNSNNSNEDDDQQEDSNESNYAFLTIDEFYRYLGIRCKMMLLPLSNPDDYWKTNASSSTSSYELLPTLNFEYEYGFSKLRFDFLQLCLQFDEKPTENEDPWWQIRGLLTAFNTHRQQLVIPGSLLAMNTIKSYWQNVFEEDEQEVQEDFVTKEYQNQQQQQYPIIFHDPKDGFTWYCLYDVLSGLVLQLEFLEEEETMLSRPFQYHPSHSINPTHSTNQEYETLLEDGDVHDFETAILLRLIQPYTHTGRIVIHPQTIYDHSYRHHESGMSQALALLVHGMNFVGHVNLHPHSLEYLEQQGLPVSCFLSSLLNKKNVKEELIYSTNYTIVNSNSTTNSQNYHLLALSTPSSLSQCIVSTVHPQNLRSILQDQLNSGNLYQVKKRQVFQLESSRDIRLITTSTKNIPLTSPSCRSLSPYHEILQYATLSSAASQYYREVNLRIEDTWSIPQSPFTSSSSSSQQISKEIKQQQQPYHLRCFVTLLAQCITDAYQLYRYHVHQLRYILQQQQQQHQASSSTMMMKTFRDFAQQLAYELCPRFTSLNESDTTSPYPIQYISQHHATSPEEITSVNNANHPPSHPPSLSQLVYHPMIEASSSNVALHAVHHTQHQQSLLHQSNNNPSSNANAVNYLYSSHSHHQVKPDSFDPNSSTLPSTSHEYSTQHPQGNVLTQHHILKSLKDHPLYRDKPSTFRCRRRCRYCHHISTTYCATCSTFDRIFTVHDSASGRRKHGKLCYEEHILGKRPIDPLLAPVLGHPSNHEHQLDHHSTHFQHPMYPTVDDEDLLENHASADIAGNDDDDGFEDSRHDMRTMRGDGHYINSAIHRNRNGFLSHSEEEAFMREQNNGVDNNNDNITNVDDSGDHVNDEINERAEVHDSADTEHPTKRRKIMNMNTSHRTHNINSFNHDGEVQQQQFSHTPYDYTNDQSNQHHEMQQQQQDQYYATSLSLRGKGNPGTYFSSFSHDTLQTQVHPHPQQQQEQVSNLSSHRTPASQGQTSHQRTITMITQNNLLLEDSDSEEVEE